MWKFITSSSNKSNWLFGHSKEVCFIGRSNVGKSSLINAITGRTGLARISNTPGRTQLINFFEENGKFLVDLPGYGYAKMPLKEKEKMIMMIEDYFLHRKELVKTFLLIDTLVGPTNDDLDMIDFLKSQNRDFMIILTKADKANQSQTHKTIKVVNELSSDILITSSLKGTNIPKLKRIINSII